MLESFGKTQFEDISFFSFRGSEKYNWLGCLNLFIIVSISESKKLLKKVGNNEKIYRF